MSKLATPFIIIVLVLSIVALVLGIQLFNQREILKGRTQRLETAAGEFAKSIHYDDFNVALLKDYEQMMTPLNQLSAQGANRWDELQDTKLDLENTKAELTSTQEKLAATEEKLVATEAQVVDLTGQLESKEVELAQANTQIEQLEVEKEDLNTQLADTQTQLENAKSEATDLKDEIASLNQTIEDMSRELGELPDKPAPRGLTGKILFLNPYWNFVVLDIGRDDGLNPNVEMLVHRKDKLIGKVRISAADDKMAIAEILTDWEVTPVKEGDYVLY
ncbi:MAG: hypothetical protein AB7T27_10900 [Kiritimatiellia bacterium]